MRPAIVICCLLLFIAASPLEKSPLEGNKLPELQLTDLNGNTYHLGKEKTRFDDSSPLLLACRRSCFPLKANCHPQYPVWTVSWDSSIGNRPTGISWPKSFQRHNRKNSSVYQKVRKAFHVPIPQFPTIAQCESRRPHSAPNAVNVECDIISNQFGINDYPTTLFVDKDGIIKTTVKGFPLKESAIKRKHKSWQKFIKRMLK